MFKAAIFDMDGVILDSELIHSKAFEKILLEDFGVTARKTEHGTVHVAGMTSAEIWESLKKEHGFDADTTALVDKKRKTMQAVLEQGAEPMPGLLDLLADLKSHGALLAIATSAQRERTLLITKKLGISGYFPIMITASEVSNVKPAPDVYIAAAEALGVRPQECIVFEDSEVGVQAAVRAGMKVVAVPNKYTHKMDFSQASLVVPSLANITYDTINDLFAK